MGMTQKKMEEAIITKANEVYQEMTDEQSERIAIQGEQKVRIPPRELNPIFSQSQNVEKSSNPNPLVKISAMWFHKGIFSGADGNEKYTIFTNRERTSENQPDYNLSITTSYMKDEDRLSKDFSRQKAKQFTLCGMWTDYDNDVIIGSVKSSFKEFVVLRNPAKLGMNNLPDYFLYVREKQHYS
jgi:hypothetical protein